MIKSKKLVIIGLGETADLAYFYFSEDTEYEVAAFSASKSYVDSSSKFGLPVIELETLELTYPVSEYEAFVAVSSSKLNTVRTMLYRIVKQKGYKMANYISPKAYIGHNVIIGDNCFIMENNTIQTYVKIGNNVVLWSGNHIGHSCVIGDNCLLTSHVVLSAFSEVGRYSFIGVNSCISNNVKIGERCLIGMGSIIAKNVANDSIMKMAYAKRQPIKASSFTGTEDFDF